jgi:hypothetical protein
MFHKIKGYKLWWSLLWTVYYLLCKWQLRYTNMLQVCYRIKFWKRLLYIKFSLHTIFHLKLRLFFSVQNYKSFELQSTCIDLFINIKKVSSLVYRRESKDTALSIKKYEYCFSDLNKSHIFSSPELKAQVSFSDRPLSVCLSICLSVRL